MISIQVHRINVTQLFIFTAISVQFGLYVLIRQLVNTKEWLTACTCVVWQNEYT